MANTTKETGSAGVSAVYSIDTTFVQDFIEDLSTDEAILELTGEDSIYDVFLNMLDKNGIVKSKIETRRNSVLDLPIILTPKDPEEANAQEVSDFIYNMLLDDDRAADTYELMLGLLDSVALGFSAAEPIWDLDYLEKTGYYLPKRYNFYKHSQITFKNDGSYVLTNNANAIEIPKYHCLMMRFNRNRSQRGHSILYPVFWYYWFSKNGIRWWFKFLEKFGSPTTIVKYRPDSTGEARKKAFEAARNIHGASSSAVPESFNVDFLEATRSGTADYKEFQDWCEQCITETILGQTGTTRQGQYGTQAQSTVQERVMNSYRRSDALRLQKVMQELVNWLVELNYGEDAPQVVFKFDISEKKDLATLSQVHERLVNAGMKIPMSHIRDIYGIPEAAEGEDILQSGGNTETAEALAKFSDEQKKPADAFRDMIDEITDKAVQESVSIVGHMYDRK